MDERHFQFAFLLDLNHLSIGQEQSTINLWHYGNNDWVAHRTVSTAAIIYSCSRNCRLLSTQPSQVDGEVTCYLLSISSGASIAVASHILQLKLVSIYVWSSIKFHYWSSKSFSDSGVLLLPLIEVWHHHCIGFFQLQTPATQLLVANSIIIRYLGAVIGEGSRV